MLSTHASYSQMYDQQRYKTSQINKTDNHISKNQAFRNQMNTFLPCQEMGNFEDSK